MKVHNGTYLGIVRVIALAAMLLIGPVTASASSLEPSAPVSWDHGLGCNHGASVLPETLAHHGLPAHPPLHCHLSSPHALEFGLNSVSVDDEPRLLLASKSIAARVREMGAAIPADWVHIPIPAPPGFILFGNFRS